MLSLDLVPMRGRIAARRGTGKPLQLAVDIVSGTTEATPGDFNRAIGGRRCPPTCSGDPAAAAPLRVRL